MKLWEIMDSTFKVSTENFPLSDFIDLGTYNWVYNIYLS